MPNLKEKKEALELAQKENLTAQRDVDENDQNKKKWEAETEKANLALKTTKEEIAKQKQVLHEATQAAEQAWETERNKTAGQNIEELQNSKTVADRKLQDVQQAMLVSFRTPIRKSVLDACRNIQYIGMCCTLYNP